MRIVFAADTYKPYISGVTIFISQHMAELRRLGHEVNLITFGRPVDDQEQGVIYNPGYQLKVGYSFGLRYSKPSLDRLDAADVIHMHHPFLTGYLVRKAVRKRNIPLIFTAHTRYDAYVSYVAAWLPEYAGLKILRAYLPEFCRKVDRVICTSEASEQGLRRCGVQSEVIRLPNGIELRRFLTAQADPEIRRQLGGEGKTLFLYVGRLAPEKNLDLLLEAFAQLLAKGCSAQLAMIGTGPSLDALKQTAERLGMSGSVTFPGLLPFDRLPAYYASADVYVMPSIYDTHPLSVLEAIASGLPVLAVKSPAYADTVFHGENGFLADNKTESLAAILELATADAQALKSMGQRSREIAKRFSVEASAERLVDLYEDLIKSRRHP